MDIVLAGYTTIFIAAVNLQAAIITKAIPLNGTALCDVYGVVKYFSIDGLCNQWLAKTFSWKRWWHYWVPGLILPLNLRL